MKNYIFLLIILIFANKINAQNINPQEEFALGKQLIETINQECKNQKAIKQELLQDYNYTNIIEHCFYYQDSINFENYQKFSFFLYIQKDNYTHITYYKGIIDQLQDVEIYNYYFVGDSLKISTLNSFQVGDYLEEVGQNIYMEDYFVVLKEDGMAKIIFKREHEDVDKNFDINKKNYTAIDPRKMFYRKDMFYSMGIELFNKIKK